MDNHSGRHYAAARTAVRRKPNRKRAVLVIMILAAVFVLAMAVVLMSVAGFRVGGHAQAEILQAFFLFAAWCAWFRFGHEQKRWALAWGWA